MRTAEEYSKMALPILAETETFRNPEERASLLKIAHSCIKHAAVADQSETGRCVDPRSTPRTTPEAPPASGWPHPVIADGFNGCRMTC